MFNGRQRPKSTIILLVSCIVTAQVNCTGAHASIKPRQSAICTKKRRKTPLSNVSVFLSFYLADVLKISIVR